MLPSEFLPDFFLWFSLLHILFLFYNPNQIKNNNISFSNQSSIKKAIRQIIKENPNRLIVYIAKEALLNRDIVPFLRAMYHYNFDWDSRILPNLPYFQNPDEFYEKFYYEINSNVEFLTEMGAFITEIENFKPTGKKDEINIQVWIGFETAIQTIIVELEKILKEETVPSKIL